MDNRRYGMKWSPIGLESWRTRDPSWRSNGPIDGLIHFRQCSRRNRGRERRPGHLLSFLLKAVQNRLVAAHFYIIISEILLSDLPFKRIRIDETLLLYRVSFDLLAISTTTSCLQWTHVISPVPSIEPQESIVQVLIKRR